MMERAALEQPRRVGVSLRQMKQISTGTVICTRCQLEPASGLISQQPVCRACRDKHTAARMRSRG